MTARGAAAAEHYEQRQRNCRELQQSVMLFTQYESFHKLLPVLIVRFSDPPARVQPSSLNLIGFIMRIFVRCSYAFC
jgi:hypothetical protein